MAIAYEDGLVRFDGHCIVDEALALTEYLAEKPETRVSLGDCLSMHASLLQVLMSGRPPIVDFPVEAGLSTALRRIFGEG